MGEYDYSRSHVDKGDKYNLRFKSPPLNLMWEQEKNILANLIFRYQPTKILDLACGTGRVSNFMADTSSLAQVTGVDISASMLNVASKHSQCKVKYIQSDISNLNLVKKKKPHDLITCFRFFTNAQEDLRVEMIKCAARHAVPDTVLVLNNHQNIDSYPLKLQNFRKREKHGVQNTGIKNLVRDFGFKFIESYSIGVSPQDELKFLLNTKLSEKIEAFNSRFLSKHHQFGINQIMIFRMNS